jgi:hypothetical protein
MRLPFHREEFRVHKRQNALWPLSFLRQFCVQAAPKLGSLFPEFQYFILFSPEFCKQFLRELLHARERENCIQLPEKLRYYEF